MSEMQKQMCIYFSASNAQTVQRKMQHYKIT